MANSKTGTNTTRFNPYDLELKSLIHKDLPKRQQNNETRKEILEAYKLFDCALSIPDIQLDDVLDDSFEEFHIKLCDRLSTYFNEKHEHDQVFYDTDTCPTQIEIVVDDNSYYTGYGCLYIKELEHHPKEFQNLKIAIGKLLRMGARDYSDYSDLLDYIIEMTTDSYISEKDSTTDEVELQAIEQEHAAFIEQATELLNNNYLLSECRALGELPLVIEKPKSDYGIWLSVIQKCYDDNLCFVEYVHYNHLGYDEAVSMHDVCYIAYDDNIVTANMNEHLVDNYNQYIIPFQYLIKYSAEGHFEQIRYPTTIAYHIIFSFNIQTLKFYDGFKTDRKQLQILIRTIYDASPLPKQRNIIH